MSTKKTADKHKAHDFALYGGKWLSKMGASWFVSYAYYDHIDKTHANWSQVSTKMRISVYKRTFSYHRYWLDKIMSMDNSRIESNRIILSPAKVKSMAKELMEAVW